MLQNVGRITGGSTGELASRDVWLGGDSGSTRVTQVSSVLARARHNVGASLRNDIQSLFQLESASVVFAVPGPLQSMAQCPVPPHL